MLDNILSKIQGTFVGVALGDAFGALWENYSLEEILNLTSGKGLSEGSFFSGSVIHKTTDDWALTSAVAKSLIRRKTFDPVDLALAHCQAYTKIKDEILLAEIKNPNFTARSPFGKTTTQAINSWQKYFASFGQKGHCPNEPIQNEPKGGLGNGVAMKISPFVWFLNVSAGSSNQRFNDLLIRFCQMTHNTEEALYFSWLFADQLTLFSHNKVYGELIFGGNSCLYSWDDDKLIEAPKDLLGKEFLHSDLSRPLKEINILAQNSKKNFYLAKTSILLSLLLAYRNQDSFKQGILDAINCGGDTDSNASMVGALLGAKLGIEAIPKEWIALVPEAQEATTLGTQFYETFYSK